jgi:NADP-dependent 3-hydroxy acid dehydrogenase YdfG
MALSHGRVVVITGGTAGVGRATARRFAVDRAQVAVLARGADGLAATSREIALLGGTPLPIQLDVADADAVFAAAARIERELGPIDVWINNAATSVFGPVERVSPAELRRVTDVTYHGTVWGTLAALRGMRARGRGTIVQVGSALAHRAIPLQAAYGAAEHAIRGFTDALRSELLHDGLAVHLTMVQLPAVNTPHFRWCENKLGCAAQPPPPIFQPELAAEAVHFAARRRRREVYLGASTIGAVLGGQLAPGLLDRYLARRAYADQCAGGPAPPGPKNLFAPVPGDHGAHGALELRARGFDPLATVGSWLGAAGVRLVVAATGAAVLAGAMLLVRRLTAPAAS